MSNAIEDCAKSEFKDAIRDGYKLRTGQTKGSAKAEIEGQLREDLESAIEDAVKEATDKATHEWYEYGIAEATTSLKSVMWDADEFTDESETEKTPEAIARDIEREANRVRVAAEWAALVAGIPAAMEVGTRYRYNAPTLTEVIPIQWQRNNAINELIANGTLVKVERTASNPPFLMLAE